MSRTSLESAPQPSAPRNGASQTAPFPAPEMPRRVAAHAWERTPLGPRSSWPQSLRTAAGICLHSRFPLWLGWGPDLFMIYNDGFKEVLQVKHPWALGRPTREVWSEVWDVIGPMMHGVLETGQATWSSDQLLVLERTGAPEETYFTWSYSPIEDDNGRIGGVFTTVKETTDRVLGERRLRTLRELGLRAAEATPLAAADRAARTFGENPHDLPFCLIYLTEDDGANATLAGWTGLQAGTAACPARLSTQESGAVWPLHEAGAAGDLLRMQRLPPGGPFLAEPWNLPCREAAVLPLASPGRAQPVGYLVAGLSPLRPLDADYRTFLTLAARHLSTAITNARALEEERGRAEELAQLDKAKTEFFSNISHEFRTPLTLMLGPLHDALSDGSLDAAQRDRLAIAERNSLRLLKLVNNLLDFSRLEAGRVKATFVATSFSPFVAELASSFRPLAERAELKFTVDCPPLAQPVFVDREMAERIVLNLLSNAFKFTFEGGIRVATRDAGDAAVLEVTDSGVGIPEAELPRLFERFHRVEGARSRTHEGTGIGLSLVQELARLHGGTVEVRSLEGHGSTFRVRFPYGTHHLPGGQVQTALSGAQPSRHAAAYAEEASRWIDGATSQSESAGAATDAMDRPDAHGPRTAPARILLVDDNADMRDYLQRVLSPRWQVVAAADGHGALAAAREQAFDLVLSDIMMPRMDGFDLLRRLRAEPATKDVPVILLSARAGEEARIQGLERGADDYLTKPFTARELLARVQTHLDLSRARQRAVALEREARESLRRANEQLDRQVREQTRVLRDRAQRLEEANAAMASMNYVLGHDLQEPVRMVAAILHVLREDHADGLAPGVREHLGNAEAATQRLARLVTGLLDLSRATSRPPDPPQTFRLAEALDAPAFAGSLRTLMTERGARLDVEDPDVVVHASLRDTGRVLANLVRNAVQHNPDANPLVRLRAASDGAVATILVEDNGPGFRPETIHEFNEGGLGTREGHFGLAICKRTLERVGGAMALETSPLGGAAVRLRLPAQPRFAPRAHVGDRGIGDARGEAAGGYGSIVQNVPGAFFRRDPVPPWRVGFMSPQVEDITGYPPTVFTQGGKSWASLVHPDDVERTAAAVATATAGQEPYGVEYRIVHADGTTRWVLDRGTAVLGDDGQATAVEGILFDVTDAKRNEEDLRQSQTRYRETSEDLMTFTNTVSHDLRAPMRTIDYYLGRLVAALEQEGKGKLVEMARAASRENMRGARLVTDLLSFSRGGHKPLACEDVDVTALATELAAEVTAQVGGAAPRWHIQSGMRAYADDGLLRVLLQTLLHNAAKYASHGPQPEVRVTATPSGDGTKITVQDNGVGFPPEETDRLFRPFTRLSTAGDFEGTGLGLATAKRIVARHGGHIAAESMPGQGATFSIFLPGPGVGAARHDGAP